MIIDLLRGPEAGDRLTIDVQVDADASCQMSLDPVDAVDQILQVEDLDTSP